MDAVHESRIVAHLRRERRQEMPEALGLLDVHIQA
jgi:hypothetical protein